MATTKVEKAGVGFGVGRQGASVVIEIRPHHDTIASIKGVQIGFELLNGIDVYKRQSQTSIPTRCDNVQLGQRELAGFPGRPSKLPQSHFQRSLIS